MPSCPICTTPLRTTRQREGLFYPCDRCNGRAMTIPQVRRAIGDRIAAKLLRLTNLGRQPGRLPCPFCGVIMQSISTQEPVLELETCRACAIVWFDLPTYELLPQLTTETSGSIQMQATEIIAMGRLQELKEREEQQREKEKKKKKGSRTVWGDEMDPNAR